MSDEFNDLLAFEVETSYKVSNTSGGGCGTKRTSGANTGCD